MRSPFAILGCLLTAAVITACNKPAPCEGIAPTKEAEALNVVMSDGKLCKAGSGVFNIDYVKDVSAVEESYQSHLEKAGWKGEKVSSGNNGSSWVYAKDPQKMLFTILKNGERNVTTAIIKHCKVVGAPDDNPIVQDCIKQIDAIAKQLKK